MKAILGTDLIVAGFDAATGTAQIYIPYNNSTVTVVMPIVDGRYLTGSLLEDYLQGFYPLYEVERAATIVSVTNANDIQSLVTPTASTIPPVDDLKLSIVMKRNMLLLASDYTQLSDPGLAASITALWRVYRQSLRDLTKQSGFPTNIVWPIAP
jgi:hypothetical protein